MGTLAERVKPKVVSLVKSQSNGRDLQSPRFLITDSVDLQLIRRIDPSPKLITSAATGMKLTLIPAGTFTMGSQLTPKELAAKFAKWDATESDFEDERPPHPVKISQPFYLGQHEVTVGQFRKFVTDDGYQTEAEADGKGGFGFDETKGNFVQDPKYTWKNPGFAQTDEHPVVNVSWNDTQKFCAWLSRQEGKTYRLPTEAEWEYACKAGTNTLWSHGDDPEGVARVGNTADATAKEKINFKNAISARDGYVFTAPVGKFPANAFGLYDMHGNVFEWCDDVYDAKLYLKRSGTIPTPDPRVASGSEYRVLRGGSWGNYAGSTRTALRSRYAPDSRVSNFGFRVVCLGVMTP